MAFRGARILIADVSCRITAQASVRGTVPILIVYARTRGTRFSYTVIGW